MAEDLNRQIVKGVSWTIIETCSMYFVRFAIGIVLARLLMPEDFGIIGMAAIFIAVSEVFVSAGFGQAYIYKKDATDKDANTVFYLNLILSIIVYISVFFAAPYIAAFFNTPELKWVIRVLFLVVVIDAFSIIQYSIIRKNLLFKRKALARLVSSVLSGVIGIVMACCGYGVWSLVVQQITSRLFMCLILYKVSAWRISFSFSIDFVKNNFGYSIWLLLSDIINTLMNNFYRIAIGKAYLTKDLGLYDTSERFKTMISDSFISIFTQVAFPSFTKVKESPSELLTLCKKYVSYSTLFIFPILIVLMVVAKPFTIILLSQKWIEVVPFIQIFCIIGLIVPYHVFLFPLLEATGNTRLVFFASIMRSVLRIINVIIAICVGNILWILYGEIAVLLIMVVMFSIISRKNLKFDYLLVVPPTIKTILISIITIGIGLFVQLVFNSIPILFSFIATAMIMIAVYLILTFLFQRQLFVSAYQMIMNKRAKNA